MELAAMMLKKLSRAAENSDNSEYFEIINQCLTSLDMSDDDGLTESWFLMRLGKAAGEEINLYRDADGEKLNPELRYFWNTGENSFVLHDNGDFGVNEIKYEKYDNNGVVGYYREPLPSDIFPNTYITIFLGGLGKPEFYLDDIISKYVSDSKQYVEYTEVFRDNPYLRMIINKVNS